MACRDIALQNATQVISQDGDRGGHSSQLSPRGADRSSQWEILGELALRLHHKEEAKEAFQRCLEIKFSAKALIKLLEMYAKEGDLQRTLNVAVRLTTYHHR